MKKKKLFVKTVGYSVLAVFMLYFGYRIYEVYFPTYKTETALLYSASDTVSGIGVAARDESTVVYYGTGVCSYTIDNMKKVALGAVVAEIFKSGEGAAYSAYMAELSDEIESLERAQAISEFTLTSSDTLSEKLKQGVLKLAEGSGGVLYENISDSKLGLLDAVNSIQIITGRASDFEERISTLRAELESVSGSETEHMESVLAEASGFYSYKTDGYEETITSEYADTVTAAELAAFLESEKPENSSYNIGKVIKDYEWRIALLTDASEVDRFTPGYKVVVNFPYAPTGQLTMRVERAEVDEELGKALVVLSCDIMNEQTAALRIEEMTVSFANYTGLKISKSAQYIVDGVRGVYVKYGETAVFKKITPIYETGSYFIVPEQGGEGNEVLLYDEVIVEGVDLYDGKKLA